MKIGSILFVLALLSLSGCSHVIKSISSSSFEIQFLKSPSPTTYIRSFERTRLLYSQRCKFGFWRHYCIDDTSLFWPMMSSSLISVYLNFYSAHNSMAFWLVFFGNKENKAILGHRENYIVWWGSFGCFGPNHQYFLCIWAPLFPWKCSNIKVQASTPWLIWTIKWAIFHRRLAGE